MKKLLFAVLLILQVLLLPCVAEENSELWQRVDENSFLSYATIVQEAKNQYSFMIKSYNKGQYEPINGNKILYTISQYSIDCEQNLYKIGVIDSYGEENKFVNGDYNRYAKFQPIVQGTAVGNVSTMLCK